MSMLANRQNNSALMSESDNDDDFDQNSSTNQQNESMMHKVKDVVSKFLHPSFLFSSGDNSRPKRKRTGSIENESEEKVEIDGQTTANGHGKVTKIQISRSSKKDDEAELTDDEISVAPTGPSFTKDLSDPEQQKKRRRTANYHQTITTTTMTMTSSSGNDSNGSHSNERVAPLTNTTNNTSFSSTRRLLDFESTSEKNHVQRSKEIEETDDQTQSSPTKKRFNIASSNRSFASNYDPSQSPLFSVGNRKPADTTTTPSRTTTNLKSNNNDFSGNFLLASSLIQRAQMNTTVQPNQSISTLSNPNQNATQRSFSTERQMLGVNYSSINSRRLPYIERLRRRTLQDCIRLNRTLDSEPLSISTIEEHTSAANTPKRNQTKAAEKDFAVQCDISTTDGFVEPTRKIQRTFPPPDIREEALSIPTGGKNANLSQMDSSSLQTQSSIVIEPFKTNNQDSNKPKVLGNVTSFSWPKFARAQDEFSKKYPDKCRAIITPPTTMKTILNSTADASNLSSNAISSNANIIKIPILNASPPRITKPTLTEIWKCPSCERESSAQVSTCSLCDSINPNYKRLSVIETTITTQTNIAPIQTISEEATATTTTTPKLFLFNPVSTSFTTTLTSNTTTSASQFTTSSAPISIVTDSLSTTATSSPLKTTTTPSIFPVFGATTSASTPITISQPLFTSTTTATSSTESTLPMPTTTSNAPTTGLNLGISSTPSAPMFGSSTPLLGTATTSTSTTIPISSMSPMTTTPSTLASSSSALFGASGAAGPPATTTTTSTNPMCLSGSSSASPALFTNPSATSTASCFTISSATSSTTPLAAGTATSGISSSTSTSLFGVGSNATTSAPAPSSIGRFSLGNSSSFGSSTTGATTNNAPIANNPSTVASTLGTSSSTTQSAPSLFGSSLNSSSTSSIGSNLFNPGPSTSSASFNFQAASATSSAATASPGVFTFGSTATQTSTSTAPSFGSNSAFGSTSTQTSTSTAPSFGSSSAFGSTSTQTSTSTAPSFGSSSAFGSSTTVPAPAFSGFGSSNPTPFMFGSVSNASSANPASSTSGTTGTTGGFAFPNASNATTSTSNIGQAPFSFGSTPPSFNFSATPNMNFGSTSSSGTTGNLFSTSTAPFGSSSNSFGLADSHQAQENNPFNAGSDNSARRPMAKAKRRTGRN